MEASLSKTISVHCNGCRQATKHTILTTREQSGSDEEQGCSWRTRFDLLECRGCEDVVLRRIFRFSEDPDEVIDFYPPRAARWLPKWKHSLPQSLRSLMDEVYTALQAGSRSIAM